MKHKNSKVSPIVAFLLIFITCLTILFVFKTRFDFQDHGTKDFGPIVTATPIPGDEKMLVVDIKQVETTNGTNLIIQKWGFSVAMPKKVAFNFTSLPIEINKRTVMLNTLNLRKNVSESNDFEQYDIQITSVDSKYDTFENIQKTKTGLARKQYGNNYPLCFEKETVTYEGTTQSACYYPKKDGGYFIVSYNFKNRPEIRSVVQSILSSFKFG